MGIISDCPLCLHLLMSLGWCWASSPSLHTPLLAHERLPHISSLNHSVLLLPRSPSAEQSCSSYHVIYITLVYVPWIINILLSLLCGEICSIMDVFVAIQECCKWSVYRQRKREGLRDWFCVRATFCYKCIASVIDLKSWGLLLAHPGVCCLPSAWV